MQKELQFAPLFALIFLVVKCHHKIHFQPQNQFTSTKSIHKLGCLTVLRNERSFFGKNQFEGKINLCAAFLVTVKRPSAARCIVRTLSCRPYHLGVGSSKIWPCSGSMSSPRKSLRPNMSLCHTVTHSVLRSTSDSGSWN